VAVLYDRVRWAVSGTPGTGNITLGSPVATFRDGTGSGGNAAIPNGTTISYVAEDGGTVAEYGRAVYSTSGPTLTRSPLWSTSGLAIAASLSSSAIVYIDALAEDLYWGTYIFASRIQGGNGTINYYLDPAGSDSNDGASTGTAWATLAHAASVISTIVNDLGQIAVTVNVTMASGTYNEIHETSFTLQTQLINVVIASATSVASDVIINYVNVFNTGAFNVLGGGHISTVGIESVTFSASGLLPAMWVTAGGGGYVIVANCVFNAVDNLYALFWIFDSLSYLGVYGGTFSVGTGVQYFLLASTGGFAQFYYTVAFVGTCAFGAQTIAVAETAIADVQCAFTGTVTGQRYSATALSAINTYGSGTSFIPGSVAGTTDASSFYL